LGNIVGESGYGVNGDIIWDFCRMGQAKPHETSARMLMYKTKLMLKSETHLKVRYSLVYEVEDSRICNNISEQ
jgi:hypothetical protein